MTPAHALPPEPPAQVAYVARSMHGLSPEIIRRERKPSPLDEPVWTWSGISMPTDIGCESHILCSVLARTRRVGWPHSITTPERIEIASAVMHRLARGASGVACAFPSGTPARAACTVVRQARPRVVRVWVRTFEDGSYRITRA